MPTTRKGLLPLIRQVLAPLIQRAFADPQFSRYLAHRFPAAFDQVHRFHFELACVSLLLLRHLILPCLLE